MKPEHVVSLILVAVAVAVVAMFLIAIVVELRKTHLRLVTILGAVDDTVTNTDGLESVVADISKDLAAGQAALEACVDRLEERLGSGASTTSGPEPTQYREEGAPIGGGTATASTGKPDAFTNY